MSAELSGTNTILVTQRRRVRARTAFATPLASFVGLSFLYSYMLFHALHVAQRDPQVVKALSAIPLFATCAAAAITSLVLGGISTLLTLGDEKWLARLPNWLGLAILLFTAEILLFP
ncbi:MAG TPA: hypothetical protein VK745_25435 [Polyangiaceae bacterium]|jgi:hypothetical protein|nr:hypothetical protein [Polyangiaceae bacterium]